MKFTKYCRFFFNTFRLTENSTLNQPGVSQLSNNKSEILEKLKLNIDNKALSIAEQNYIRKIRERNFERYRKEQTLRKHYRITGALLLVFFLSVYGYTMYVISQEKFLDDFEEPEPPDPAVKQFRK